MSEKEPQSASAQKEFWTLYLERYKRIKDERKTILNTLIGLSGSSIVLSITFLDKIAPHKRVLPLVVLAWCLFGLTLMVSINTLMTMIRRSQKLQRKLELLLRDMAFGDGPLVDRMRPHFRSVTEPNPPDLAPEQLSGILFGLGVFALGAFAIINLVAG